ncbi:hypothetical protein KY366_00175 [Candidatus Woesearchaeota archaeon]|nr:hypothetical protein [Candidatus Woesearchaeota archaeon]
MILVLGVSFVFGAGFECWQYDGNQTGCEAQSSICTWMADTWADGGGWCNQLGCWNFWDETDCNAAADSNMSCTWKTGGGTNDGWCSEKGCWLYYNQSSCQAHSTDLGCSWNSDYSYCYKPGCWDQTTSSGCTSATDYKGNACQWDSSGNFCYEKGCWNFNTPGECTGATTLNCNWNSQYQYCEEINCWIWDYTNSSACQNNAYNLSCTYNDPWCNQEGCWNIMDKTTCQLKDNCEWNYMENYGWCEEVGCWNWYGEGQDACVGNGTLYGLNCTYHDPYCEEDMSAGCTMYNNNEKGCMDTYYCIYNKSDSTCRDPIQIGFNDFDMDQDFMKTGCWIMDYNSTRCNQVRGCFYNASAAACQENASNNSNIVNGIRCTDIVNNTFCKEVPFLGGCCSWNGSSCNKAPMSKKCWDNIEDPGDGAHYCVDYNVLDSPSKCRKIAGDPWYMPCAWDNSSSKCYDRLMEKENINDVKEITNKKQCEDTGGSWVVEYYCNGNQTVPFGWCEPKVGAGAKSCKEVCWACEFRDASGKNVTSANAKSSCEDSPLGYCTFKADTYAPNGIGLCVEKQEYKKSGGGDCNTKCSVCTYMGKTVNEAMTACKNSAANCTWFADPDDSSKGWCDSQNKEGCTEDCGECFTDTSCRDKGGLGSGKNCTWSNGMCVEEGTSGGSTELCYDGEDNDGDGYIDCGDSKCFGGDFCGGSFMSNCGMYEDNNTCNPDPMCAWVNNSDGEWCEMIGGNCWMYADDQNGCTNTEGCQWDIPPTGGMCDMNQSQFSICNGLNNVSCTTAPNNASCSWTSSGFCNRKNYTLSTNCMMYDFDRSGCEANADCEWRIESFCSLKVDTCFSRNETACAQLDYCVWNYDEWMQSYACRPHCFNSSLTQSQCLGKDSCQWSAGICMPGGVGGGGMGVVMMDDCWKFENDQTQCNNQSSCMWMEEQGQFCDVDTSNYCKDKNQTSCQAEGNCSWWTDPTGNSWCDYKAWECNMNSSRQSSAALCTAGNSFCSWDNAGYCKPKCFNSSLSGDSTACTNEPGCMMRSGWCEGKMMGMMFQGDMMSQPPTSLGFDGRNSSIAHYSDIRSFGTKDEPDNWGLGISVHSIKDAAICNGESTRTSWDNPLLVPTTGTKTTRFYWYLDTDGDATGGCNAINDSSYPGFEFRLNYVGVMSSGELKETRVAYRCQNGNWTAAEIMLSSWKKAVCDMVGGGMISIQKSDLNTFTALYDPTEDMRVMVAAANGSRDYNSPLDYAGPSYYSPNQFDFRFEDCMCPECDMDGDGSKAKDDPDCGGFQKYGFFMIEDCFQGSGDEDGDGLTNCEDSDCKDFWFCLSTWEGVEDTTAPKLVHKEIDEYPDGGHIAIDTDESTNITVIFCGNNSRCNLTTAINVTDNTVDKRHSIDVRNITGGVNYKFANGTTYFYKVQMTDKSNNTAKSRTLNFTTAKTSSRKDCPDCRMVVRFDDIPEGWNVNMNHEGQNYTQGCLDCGKAAGLLVWYNETLDIEFVDNTTNAGIKLVNVTPRTLAGNSRTVDEGDFEKSTVNKAGGGTADFVKAEKDKFDDIRDKLRPEECRVYIPGNNTELWHCGDESDSLTCKNRTNESSKIGYHNSTDVSEWTVPNCEFSSWGDGAPAPSSGTTSGGGGGGGGGNTVAQCKDGIDNDGDGLIDYPADPDCVGYSDTTEGVPVSTECKENWVCTSWSECSKDGQMTRICRDYKNCGTVKYKPTTRQSCAYSPQPPAEAGRSVGEIRNNDGVNWKWDGSVWVKQGAPEYEQIGLEAERGEIPEALAPSQVEQYNLVFTALFAVLAVVLICLLVIYLVMKKKGR